jgi:hypothetical protein
MTASYIYNKCIHTEEGWRLSVNVVPISIENLLFGSDNLTDENNLIVFRNVQKCIHHANRFGCQI